MGLTDVIAVVAGLALAYEIRFGGRGPDFEFILLVSLAPLLVPVIFGLFRLYEVHHFTAPQEFRRVLLAVTVAIMMWITVSFWAVTLLSRLWITLSWFLSLAIVLAERRLWRSSVRRARAEGRFTFRTLVIGANEEAERLAHLMRSERLGFRPLGYVATGLTAALADSLPVVGDIGNLRELVRGTGADCLFVASSSVGFEDMRLVSQAARLEHVEVHLTANLPEVLTTRLAIQPLRGGMSLTLRPMQLLGARAVVKRMFDVVLASIGLLVTAPVWLAVALAIKLTSRGPVLYRQERVGQKGRLFTIYKFRTMVAGADQMLDNLRSLNEASGPLFKLRRDPRVTRVGRWLRRHSLDEVPQLLNVLKGDMTLVGPRPPLPSEVQAYESWHFDRLEVRPGVTGLWQVSGRSDLSFEEYVRRDLFYIDNWSLALDLYILAKTIPKMLLGSGAY